MSISSTLEAPEKRGNPQYRCATALAFFLTSPRRWASRGRQPHGMHLSVVHPHILSVTTADGHNFVLDVGRFSLLRSIDVHGSGSCGSCQLPLQVDSVSDRQKKGNDIHCLHFIDSTTEGERSHNIATWIESSAG